MTTFWADCRRAIDRELNLDLNVGDGLVNNRHWAIETFQDGVGRFGDLDDGAGVAEFGKIVDFG